MSIFDPFADLSRLRHQIDRLVDESSRAAKPGENGRVWRPAVDLFEDENGFTLAVDVPDVEREKLDIQLTGEELVIRGERKWAQPERGGCLHSERPYGQFQRVFRLGVPVQSDAVDASYRNGVLTIRLPKAQSVTPRKVTVRTDEE